MPHYLRSYPCSIFRPLEVQQHFDDAAMIRCGKHRRAFVGMRFTAMSFARLYRAAARRTEGHRVNADVASAVLLQIEISLLATHIQSPRHAMVRPPFIARRVLPAQAFSNGPAKHVRSECARQYDGCQAQPRKKGSPSKRQPGQQAHPDYDPERRPASRILPSQMTLVETENAAYNSNHQQPEPLIGQRCRQHCHTPFDNYAPMVHLSARCVNPQPGIGVPANAGAPAPGSRFGAVFYGRARGGSFGGAVSCERYANPACPATNWR